MVGGVPVVTAPAEIDTTTVGELQAILQEWHSRGDVTVVIDMSATQFCDSSGVRELVRAHRQAVASGGGLLLVLPSAGSLLRSFTITGPESIVPYFDTMDEALANIPRQAIYPRRRAPAPAPAAASTSLRAPLGASGDLVTDSRGCAQCNALFVPQREHSRFCSGECRAAWNGEHLGDPAAETSALTWSIAAMNEATALLPAVEVSDQPGAFAAIGEAVWWVTMVDATLVRHHADVYGNVMAARALSERQLIDESLAGLRFVRNWISREIGLRDLVNSAVADRHVTSWTWKTFPAPALAWLSPQAQAWELARYRAYQARLAGCTIGETFRQAGSFLTLVGASAEPNTDGYEPVTCQAGGIGSCAGDAHR